MNKYIPALAMALGFTGLALLTPAQAATSNAAAAADAHVNSRSVATNYADSTALKVDGTTGRIKHAFLKFTVPTVPAGQTLNGVGLRLTPSTTSTRGVTVYRTGNSWAEGTLKWQNMPTERTLLGSSDALRAGTVEVIALDTARLTPGQVLTVRVETTAASTLSFASSEAATTTTRPVLALSTSSTPTPTATATPTPTATATPTPTATATPTPTTLLRPYTTDSYFKSPVAGVPVDATKTEQFHSFMASHPDQAGTSYPLIKGVGGNKWGTTYAEGKATDPVWRVRTIAGTVNAKNSILQTQGFRAPEWLGSALTGTSDSPAAVLDKASGFTVFITKAAVVGDHLLDVESAGVTWHSSNGLDYRNLRSDDKRNFTSRGRISDATVIRRDLVDHAIANNTDLGHVLHFFIVESSTTAGFAHPMVGTESDKFGWGAEGQRLAIRADIDLTTRGLSPAGLVIARTLQRYGMYIGDNAGGPSSLKAEQETAAHPVWNGMLTASSLSGLKWSDFDVLSAS